MSYSQKTIQEVIESINRNEMYLPAIQRKFVWEEKRITKLFDSILQGYPIGTFLFWEAKKEQVTDSIFYRFITNYHQGKAENEKAPFPEAKELITGVLDGQQRLSSIYISLQGTYRTKKKHAKSADPESYAIRELYINILDDSGSGLDENLKYQ